MEDQAPLRWKTLFAYPFRAFFFATAVWALLAIPLWIMAYRDFIQLPFALAPTAWHAHEMLFGFFPAALAGFLLTTVCVWTKTERTHGLPLALLWGLWVLGRVTMLIGYYIPFGIVVAIQVSFLIGVLYDAAKRILPQRQRRQYPLLVIVLLLIAMQLGFLLTGGLLAFSKATLMLALGMMWIIGGRITPAFSRNWLKRQGREEDAAAIQSPAWVETLTLVSIFTLIGVVAISAIPAVAYHAAYGPSLAIVAIAAAALSSYRLWRWRGWTVRNEPLLWVLHLALAWIPVTLVLMALSALELAPNLIWIHALSIGPMSALIHGVISRVGLGHTGRPLVLPKGIATAYVLLQIGALVRLVVELPVFRNVYLPGLDLSSAFWGAAFLMLLIRYTPMLFRPRVDGKEG